VESAETVLMRKVQDVEAEAGISQVGRWQLRVGKTGQQGAYDVRAFQTSRFCSCGAYVEKVQADAAVGRTSFKSGGEVDVNKLEKLCNKVGSQACSKIALLS
jgi:hypothetical protein